MSEPWNVKKIWVEVLQKWLKEKQNPEREEEDESVKSRVVGLVYLGGWIDIHRWCVWNDGFLIHVECQPQREGLTLLDRNCQVTDAAVHPLLVAVQTGMWRDRDPPWLSAYSPPVCISKHLLERGEAECLVRSFPVWQEGVGQAEEIWTQAVTVGQMTLVQ